MMLATSNRRWLRFALISVAVAACGDEGLRLDLGDQSVAVQQSALVTQPWQLVGPRGYVSGERRFTGTISDAERLPPDTGSNPPGILRVAATAGGIFEHNETTGEWTNLTKTLVPTHSPRVPGEGLAATTLASNPANGFATLVFGTADPPRQGVQRKSGIWRGTRSGGVWSWTNPIKETSVGNVRRMIWGGGGHSARVHAAADTGYWFSDNAGVTWTKFTTGCNGTLDLTDLADFHGQYLLAVGKCSADTQWNLWKRAPGQNWTRIHTLNASTRWATLAVGATNAYVLAGRGTDPTDDAVVERFNTNTNQYFSSSTGIPQIGHFVFDGFTGAIAVDPSTDARVYVGAQFLARNSNFGAGTWESMSSGHGDYHRLSFFRAFNAWQLYGSDDGGLFSTDGFQTSFQFWADYNTIPISHVTSFDVVPNWNGNVTVYVNTWDCSMGYGTDTNTVFWSRGNTGYGDGGYVAMDPGASGVVWATGNTVGAFATTGFMSTDGFVNVSAPLGRNRYFVHDQVPSVFLYSYDSSGDPTGIYVSTNPRSIPPTWTKVADGPNEGVGYRGFAVGRWSGGSYLYIATANSHNIWVAPPGATTFSPTNAPLADYETVRAWVSANSLAPKTAYAFGSDLSTGAPVVVRTQDGGATWKNIAGNLPSTLRLREIAADPGNADVVFVTVSTGDTGIYKTTNASASSPSWSRWVAGLPAGGSNAPADMAPSLNFVSPRPWADQLRTLDLGPGNRWIYAGFWGGSIWKRRTDGTD
jgi:hypothetical protein